MTDFNKKKINYSYIKVGIIIYNSGSTALEEYKLRLEVEEKYQDISEDNTEGGFSPLIGLGPKNNYYIDKNFIVFKPPLTSKILIQKDNRYFEFFLKPKPEENDIKIKWHFLAKDFDKVGIIILKIAPIFDEVRSIREPNKDEADRKSVV